ncbi:Restriction endonuclease, type II, HindVP [uncultured Caudovirales phage]|uniref:Restriction endonuclease, type II, HindVP n=1 Tax=uncultured Caudovirales phage TaxID=2100421 RepID=A0A6J5LJJ0_9CAUD|nr:Restriction endonuclease, type II, HindVP [uncultured Caudovirales phage]
MDAPSLYGIAQSNRSGDDLWGKNQFNSTFPASLCCYMRDKNINPVYISTDSSFVSKAKDTTITFDDVFNSKLKNNEINFLFESNFQPYAEYLHDTLDHTDLVTNSNGVDLRPLEVKLTVIPDSTTCELADESLWGSELVIRPDSISYACLGIYKNLVKYSAEIRKLIEPTTIKIESWENTRDILNHSDEIIETLTNFFKKYSDYQIPFLIQPIWKTKGKSPELDDNAFDVFVWSDFALLKLAIDQEISVTNRTKVSRYLRSSARTIRALSDLFVTNKIHVNRIFRQMALGNQTDKEFALSGRITRNYMEHSRLVKPILKKETLKEIILNGGEKKLSPERRFDATIYFTASHLFES